MKLDYTIRFDDERASYIEKNLTGEESSELLDKYADYILYGERRDGRPKTEPMRSPRHGSFKKKCAQSLDALFSEDPPLATIESRLSELRPGANRATNPKPKLPFHGSAEEAEIPGLASVRESIDYIGEAYNEAEPNTFRKSILRHLLIDLRKEQYHLWNDAHPTIQFKKIIQGHAQFIEWDVDSGYVNNKGDFVLVREHTIDYTNPIHIRSMLLNYSRLKEFAYEILDSWIWALMEDLDRLIKRTHLTQERFYILVRRIDGASCLQIAQALGRDWTESKVSRAFGEICNKIALTAKILELEFDRRKDPAAWKICPSCGRVMLRSHYFFTARAGTWDGLAYRCKCCDKAARENRPVPEFEYYKKPDYTKIEFSPYHIPEAIRASGNNIDPKTRERVQNYIAYEKKQDCSYSAKPSLAPKGFEHSFPEKLNRDDYKNG